MPAGIAVKVNQAQKNTQNASVNTDKKAAKASDNASAANEKVLNSDFKKLLEKNIKNKKAVKHSAENKIDPGIKISGLNKSGKEKKLGHEKNLETDNKLNPEKLLEKQAEAAVELNPDVSEKLKSDNLVCFDSDIKKKTAEAVIKSSDKNSELVAAAGTLVNREKTSDIKPDNEIKKIRTAESNSEKTEKNENVKLQVLDLRTGDDHQGKNENGFSSSDGNTEKFDLLTENTDRETNTNQIKDALFIKADSSSEMKSDVPVKSLTTQQNAVLEKLKADGNNEIVKQTKMILSDNNTGEIRMVLKPERLGYVRIKLNLDDNNIVGRIIVDNNNIKEIFENNMDSLLKNFRESGYGSASLEVSVGGGKSQQQNMDGNERFFSKKIIEDVDNHNIVSSDRSSTNADSLIDLVV